jgi:predicted acetyltransferase
MRLALLHPTVGDEEWEKWKSGWEEDHLAITAWDGDRCVGHAGAFHFDTLVPGGRWLPTAGITRVGVLPTHTRRGLLTSMMRRLLDDERADGKVFSSLRASEAVIYGRFGFGLAGKAISVVIDPRRIPSVAGAADGTFRLLKPEEAMDVVPPLYARMSHRAGAVTRTPTMWRRELEAVVDRSKAQTIAVHTSTDGVDDGYCYYQLNWKDDFPGESYGVCELFDLFATSPAAELALWNYMVNLSLVRSIRVDNRPVDDLVELSIADPRAYEVKARWDEQWVRLLDVEACLAARCYGQSGEAVTIAVDDPWYPDNTATFRVSSSGVERTDADAELHAPIASLSATYMGTTTWRDLVAVGRVRAATDDAAGRADRLFTHYPGTWSSTFF